MGEKLQHNLEVAHDLVRLAESKGITVSEPFTGKVFDSVTVLGPSQDYYEELMSQFDGMPSVKQAEDARAGVGLLEGLFKAAEKALKKIFATWGEDKIDDEDTTSAKNNSSVITQIVVDDRRLLFTRSEEDTFELQSRGPLVC